MQEVFFEADSLNKLSNKELAKKYWKLNEILTNCKSLSYDYKNQLYNFLSLYESEIERRIDEDLLEEDEIETLYEFFDDNNNEVY